MILKKEQIKIKLIDKFYVYRFYLLFLTICINLLLPPLLNYPILDIVLRLFSNIILVMSGVNFLEINMKKLRFIWAILGIFIIVISIISEYASKTFFFLELQYGLKCLFFIIITSSILKQISSTYEVTNDVILGSFCGYVLLGFISYFFFMLLDITMSNSFTGLSDVALIRSNQLFYYTFTCLTTLGMGDILPANIITQRVSIITAIIGQFYIAIVVAILISRYLQFKKERIKKINKEKKL